MNALKAASRVFTADKVIENRLLNVLGAQVLRTVIARAMHLSRSTTIAFPHRPLREALDRDGVLVWPAFLSQERFDALARECEQLADDPSRMQSRMSGPNACRKALVRDSGEDATRELRRFLDEDRLRNLLQAAERRDVGNLLDVAEIEDLVQGTAGSGEDPQSQWHSDIFFASHKAWFYLTDVTLAHGPLAFVSGSHRLSLPQLASEYAHSTSLGPGVDRSRRIRPAEMEALKARERIIEVARNTLVVANTCGYHRRLQGEEGRRRLSIHIELRANPFRALWNV